MNVHQSTTFSNYHKNAESNDIDFLLFVSRDLFCQLFGVELRGDVGVVRRLGADETRDDPHGRGGGRGAPHEIHGGRRQALGQVLLIHGDGLLLDRGGGIRCVI